MDPNFYYTVNGFIIHNVSEIPPNAIVQKNSRLLGGKGGFGSMLRAIGSQIEKTTNREMCRDLNGRRMRDVNNEKRLKEWLDKADVREREKLEAYLEKRRQRRQLLDQGPSASVPFEEKNAEDQRKQISEELQDAIAEAFQRRANKIEEKIVKPKKIHISIDSDLETSGSSSGHESGPSSPVSSSQLINSIENESPNDQSSNESATVVTDNRLEIICDPLEKPHQLEIPDNRLEKLDQLEIPDNCLEKPDQLEISDNCLEKSDQLEIPDNCLEKSDQLEMPDNCLEKPDDRMDGLVVKKARTNDGECVLTESLSLSQLKNEEKKKDIVYDSIDLEQVGSVKHLLTFGADWIKYDLARRGLKCGGTLMERASRLYSVRGLKEYPSNLLAGATVKRKRK